MFGFENLQIASEKSSFDFFPVSICIYPCIRTVKNMYSASLLDTN